MTELFAFILKSCFKEAHLWKLSQKLLLISGEQGVVSRKAQCKAQTPELPGRGGKQPQSKKMIGMKDSRVAPDKLQSFLWED